jgi:hypothetical protein
VGAVNAGAYGTVVGGGVGAAFHFERMPVTLCLC